MKLINDLVAQLGMNHHPLRTDLRAYAGEHEHTLIGNVISPQLIYLRGNPARQIRLLFWKTLSANRMARAE